MNTATDTSKMQMDNLFNSKPPEITLLAYGVNDTGNTDTKLDHFLNYIHNKQRILETVAKRHTMYWCSRVNNKNRYAFNLMNESLLLAKNNSKAKKKKLEKLNKYLARAIGKTALDDRYSIKFPKPYSFTITDDKDTSGVCEWCGIEKDVLLPYKDIEEGVSAEPKDVCLVCIEKDKHKLDLELDLMEQEYYEER